MLVACGISVIGTGPVLPPRKIRLGELDGHVHDLYTVTTEGTVIDVMPDEVDARFDILLLKDGPVQLPLFVPTAADNADWAGARIRVTGDYGRLVSGVRRFSGHFLTAELKDLVLLAPPEDPFAAPALDPGNYRTPREVAAMDRHTLVGRVLATWNGDSVMLRTGDLFANVHLIRGKSLPPIGTLIKASGYPEADLYRINLVKSDWMTLDGARETEEPAETVSAGKIVRRANGKTEIDNSFHGRLIHLRGTIRRVPSAEDTSHRLIMDADDIPITVDFSVCPNAFADVAAGSVVEITGRCLLEVETWRPYDVFPQITGMTLLMRTPADLRVVMAPPWWTPKRLLVVVVALSAILFGLAAWVRSLSRLVERRGRELFRADIERASEALRVEERTRLAVEIHDSLSQNLAGIALQIKTGRMELAEWTLKSCREELRNCLWDLRSNAINCDSMDEAIRQALAPQIGDLRLFVRFNVPRKSLSDNTAYTILRIVRELAVNAIRHGHATTLHIAGSLEPERIRFSVADDGCGFDPDARPGIAEGHFGLQGVEERVASLEGSLEISSHPGAGAKITVVLPVTGPKTSPRNNP